MQIMILSVYMQMFIFLWKVLLLSCYILAATLASFAGSRRVIATEKYCQANTVCALIQHGIWLASILARRSQAGSPLLLQDKLASYIYGPGGMLLEDVVGTSGSDVYYYHTDRLGSVRALTTSTGGVSNTYTYDDYGKTLTSTGSVYNPFKYTGEYTTQRERFIYLRERGSDPENQQFTICGPGTGLTEEAWAYVGGSPTNAGISARISSPDGWQRIRQCPDQLRRGSAGGRGGRQILKNMRKKEFIKEVNTSEG